MTDAQLMSYVVMKALERGAFTLPQALAVLNAIDAGTFVPANFPLAVAALQVTINALTNAQNVLIPELIAQAQNLQTSPAPI